MSALDQIARLSNEAIDAVAKAGSTAELEQIRVLYLGRKAELPNLLRQVAQLPADQRAATGRAAN
jgi:phenylalanyl-tRNA synthetase alpha chain